MGSVHKETFKLFNFNIQGVQKVPGQPNISEGNILF